MHDSAARPGHLNGSTYSVRSYPLDQGVSSGRLVATGKGMCAPAAGNDSATGRQQNRRVEVIINNPTAAKL
jgi:outer membrane protein OmpA-like peptidoglycan-associated protein